jgi:tetratricopeptide (TPR) repeat protein
MKSKESPNEGNRWLEAIDRSSAWLELGDYEEAARELEGLPEELANHPAILWQKHLAAAQKNDWPQALALCEKLIEMLPDEVTFLSYHIGCLYKTGQHEKAKAELKLRFEQFPDYPLFHLEAARIFAMEGSIEKAKPHLLRALQLDENGRIRLAASKDFDLEKVWEAISNPQSPTL